MVDILSNSEIAAFKKAKTAALNFNHFASPTITFQEIDSALAKLEKLEKSPGKVFSNLVMDLAIASSENPHNNKVVSNVANRAISLLEKWKCEPQLAEAVESFYYFDRIFAVNGCFVNMVSSLANLAKSSNSIGILAQIKQDIDGNSGVFLEIGYMFECSLNKESFERAQSKWNRNKVGNPIDLHLPIKDFDALNKIVSMYLGDIHLYVKNKKLRFYTSKGQIIRDDLLDVFKILPDSLSGKIASVNMDFKKFPYVPISTGKTVPQVKKVIL